MITINKFVCASWERLMVTLQPAFHSMRIFCLEVHPLLECVTHGTVDI